MAGKARVHELAKELGLSSKQVLTKLLDLGVDVKSPSSTVEASVARTLRDSLPAGTGRDRAAPAGRRVGYNPAPRPASIPPQRPRPGRSDTSAPRVESIEEEARRRRAAASKPRGSGRRQPPKLGLIAEVILEWNPSLRGYGGESIDPMVFEWEKGWAKQRFFPDEVRAWLAAGLSPNQYAKAAELHDERWRAEQWARRHGRPPNSSPFR